VLLAFFDIPRHLGYAALALFVGLEASGVPVPGETALITSAVLASKGKLSIVLVVVIAAAAAIAGDNVGYALGSRFGRRLLERAGRTREKRLAILRRGDALFARHGAKAVFFGRWIAGLRIWAAWLAGMTSMRWHSFLLWNALGGIAWAAFFGVLGYLGGEAAARLAERVGIGAAIAVGAAVVIAYLIIRRRAAGEL
jgi:membrane protein DedA with SNARE-associated domain